LLYVGLVSSQGHPLTVFKTLTGHLVTVGCWSGSIEELRELALLDRWPSGNPPEVLARYRPRLLAACAMVEAELAAWGVEP
jgi:hypothetical protein